MTTILGIDLGTTNSGAAIWKDGAPVMIFNAEGNTLTPSVVALDTMNKQWVVGRAARIIAEASPLMAIYSIKRFMGRRFGDETIQQELRMGHILYSLEECRRRRDSVEVVLGEHCLTPQEVSAKILQKIKADAEAYLEQKISDAVITVPAYFHDSQRQATRDAGRIAGLEVRRVLNEPTAACLAFGYQKLAKPRRLVAVYDLGGGTFDISILEVGRGPFRVRATKGNTHLGGDDLDWMIVDWIREQIGLPAESLGHDVQALAHLRAVAEQAKIALSTVESARMQIPGPLSPDCELHDLDVELTRVQLEVIARDFVAQTLEPCRKALQDARIKSSDLAEVLLVGGQTQMPSVRRAVWDFFGIEPDTSLPPEEVVALGAAVQAAILTGEATGLKLADVVPLTLGVNTRGRMDPLILRNTPIPIEKAKTYSTAVDNQESVEIQVYQGEKPLSADNTKLAAFILHGIEPARTGEPEIEITFRVDQDGILHVTGKDLRSPDNFKETTITDSIRLTDEEIQAIIQDAETHAAEYEAQRCQVELQDQAKSLHARLQHLLDEARTDLPAELIATVESALTEPVADDLTQHITNLTTLWRKIREIINSERDK